jgi:EAL domain-containing protein (putative c-di-GMP-specific phosphodiesterase class I)
VDEIKIDKSFVQHMATDQSDMVIVRSIVDLGRNLGLKVVAEGVESSAAWHALAALGCDVIQGFVLTPALEPAALRVWLGEYEGGAFGAGAADVVRLRTPSFRRT